MNVFKRILKAVRHWWKRDTTPQLTAVWPNTYLLVCGSEMKPKKKAKKERKGRRKNRIDHKSRQAQ